MIDVMIDLETMGTSPDAAIVAIGAAAASRETGRKLDGFYRTVNLESAVAAGGVMDGGTVMWWLRQSSEARDAIATRCDLDGIKDVLDLFKVWLINLPTDELCVWGNGATFDNVVLARAYKRLGREVPWSYRNDRCYRTLKALFPEVPEPERKGTHHNAFDDALHQSDHLILIFKHMRGEK